MTNAPRVDARLPKPGERFAPAFVTEHGRSFEEFYRAELTGLVVLARALAPPGLGEDVAQEAMMVAYRRWSTIRELAHPEAYVRRVCANLAVSQFRRGLAEVRAFRRTGAPQVVEQAGSTEDFWRLVRSLPRRQGQVVALFYVFDLSVAEVARTLEVSEGSVKVHLSRARQSLARSMGRPAEVQP
jgi:RNA polymerase sigma-70 factor (ECF subfamily)